MKLDTPLDILVLRHVCVFVAVLVLELEIAENEVE